MQVQTIIRKVRKMTQVVEVGNTKSNLPVEIPESWGTESVTTKDAAPTFLAIDPKTGQIKKSTTGEVLADKLKAIDVICVKHMKEHQYVDQNGKTLYRHPYDEKLKSNETVMMSGVPTERIGAHVFFFLISGKENEGVVVYSARKTSRWAAEKTILPRILAWKRANTSIADQTFKFKSEEKINDNKQKYFVCHFEPGNPTTKEQKALAYYAYKELTDHEEKIHQTLSEETIETETVPY